MSDQKQPDAEERKCKELELAQLFSEICEKQLYHPELLTEVEQEFLFEAVEKIRQGLARDE